MGFDRGSRPYAGFGMGRYVRLIHSSWPDPGWRSLLVQRFAHAPVVEEARMQPADVHLTLAEAGHARLARRVGGKRSHHDWRPGWLGLTRPDQPVFCSYRAERPLRSLQVHIPMATLERTAERLGGGAVDYERMTASLEAGDPVLNEAIRALDLAAQRKVGDLYAESAAEFLAVHLLTYHTGRRVRPAPEGEDTRIRAIMALMRDRLAEPLTLADIAGEVNLSVYHLVRVFKDATGEPPHRYLTRLRVEEAQRLLRNSDLPIADIASRCGFAAPGALSAAFLRHTGIRPSTYRDH